MTRRRLHVWVTSHRRRLGGSSDTVGRPRASPQLHRAGWPLALRRVARDVGYRGPVCIEVEDRAYEGSVEQRKRALRQSMHYLEQFTGW